MGSIALLGTALLEIRIIALLSTALLEIRIITLLVRVAEALLAVILLLSIALLLAAGLLVTAGLITILLITAIALSLIPIPNREGAEMTILQTADLKKYYGQGTNLTKALDGVDPVSYTHLVPLWTARMCL